MLSSGLEVEEVAQRVSDDLSSVQWDFADARSRDPIHGIHPYPARFIPQIPRELIRLFPPRPGTVVLDPFSGSGTTLVEAVRAGFPAVGIDLNPLAALIARVKTTPISQSLVPLAQSITTLARTEPAPIPDIPRLDHWFQPVAQDALARLVQQIDKVEDLSARDALKVALARIVVRVSNQESDTRYAAVEKQISLEFVYELFVKSAQTVDHAVHATYGGMFAIEPSCRVINRNVLDVLPDEIGPRAGLVITSPPYPNAYEYWLYHKYRMYWLGMDPISVREAEIGARPHYFKKNHQTETDFEIQMGLSFSLLSHVTDPGAIACFLVGRSVIHGRHIDNAALLRRAAAPHGFRSVANIERRIPPKRKAFNPANSPIDREEILLFLRV